MKKTKRLIALLLAAMMLAGCVSVSDTDETDVSESTSAETEQETVAETEEEYTFDVPSDMKYNGKEFRFLTNPGENETTKVQFIQFGYDTDSGDVFDSAIFARNMFVQDYHDIKLVVNESGGLTDVTAFRKSVQAQADDFEIGIWIDRFALTLAQEGLVIPLDELAESHVNLDKPWWLDDVNKDLTINHKLYFGAGAYDLSIYGNIQMLLFNKTMAENLGLDDMYEMVRGGTWTIDQMHSYMERAAADTNGNGRMDEEDRWGACYIGNFYDFSTTAGNDAYFVMKDENDLPYFSAPNNERLISICESLVKLMKDPNTAISVDKISDKYKTGHVYENVVTMFADGNTLFAGSGTYYLNNLRNMSDEFGVLPFPKYEEVAAGTPYKSWLFGVLGYIVPITVSDKDMVSAVLETIAYSSYKYVVPPYLDTVLANKQVRDPDSAEMIDMLSKNFCIDLAHTYFLEAVSPVFSDAFVNGEANFASKVKSNQKIIGKKIEVINKAFLEQNVEAN